MINALERSDAAWCIFFKTQYLNSDTSLNNWVPLKKAHRLTRDNFQPQGATPLYDKTLTLLSGIIFEKLHAVNRGQLSRWCILLITDGDDTASKNSADKVKLILDEMLKTGELLANCEPDDMVSGDRRFWCREYGC